MSNDIKNPSLTLGQATHIISARIIHLHLVDGLSIEDAVDAVLGSGTTAKIASDLYDAFTKVTNA